MQLGYRTKLFFTTLLLLGLMGSGVSLFVTSALEQSVESAPVEQRAEQLQRIDDIRYQSLALVVVLAIFASLIVSAFAAGMFARTMRSLIDYTDKMSKNDELDVPSASDSVQDLSERLADSVVALARERDRFGVVLDSMSEAVVALDARYRVVLLNGAAEDLFAQQLSVLGGDALGQRVTELLRMPALIELLENARAEGASAELTLPGPPERRLMARVSPKGEDAGAVLVFHDVTELRKLETMRRDFVANVSHELRTPVSVILATSETLLSDELDDLPRMRRFLEALNRNADRISRLISDLLDISRLEAGRFKLNREPVSAFGAALHVLDSLEDKMSQRRQSLDLDIDIEQLVYADAKALDQILFNLIDNAIKYAGDGGELVVRAHVVDEEHDDAMALRIEVCDDGPGLPPEHRQRIFERFYRVDDGRSRDVGGTGLGLSIVKHLVSAMGGRVGVKPNKPDGSIFWFQLPLAHEDDTSSVELAQSVDVVRG